MLMIAMLAGASGLMIAAAPAQSCAAQQNVVAVSLTPSAPEMPKQGMKLPDDRAKDRGPAVLLPECKAEPRKKRKRRLSDYPMA
jgi:hypothetical protein